MRARTLRMALLANAMCLAWLAASAGDGPAVVNVTLWKRGHRQGGRGANHNSTVAWDGTVVRASRRKPPR